MPIDPSQFPDQPQASTQTVSAGPKTFDPSTFPDQPQPGLIERLGGWGGIAATGTRALSGLLSAEGGPLGAGISGVGETLAEKLEGKPYDPTSIATEAAFGAVPFGKVVKGANLAADVLRSGALGAAHQAVSSLTHGQDPLSSQTGLAGLLGGAGGAIGSRFMRPAEAAVAPAEAAANRITVPPQQYEVVPTAQTGPGTSTLGGGKLKTSRGVPGEGGNVKLQGGERTVALQPQPIKGPGLSIPAPETFPDQPVGGLPLHGGAPTSDDLAKLEADRMVERAIPADADYVPGKVGKTYESDAGSVKYTWEPNEEEPEPPARSTSVTRAQQLAGLPTPKSPVQQVIEKLTGGTTPQTPVTPSAPDTPLTQLFKSPVDAVAAARPMGPFQEGQNPVSPLANQQLGVALSAEAQRAGLPTTRGANLAGFLKSRVSPQITADLSESKPPTPGVTPPPPVEAPGQVPPPDVPAVTGISENERVNRLAELQKLMNAQPEDIQQMHSGLGVPGLPELTPEVRSRLASILTGSAVGGTLGAGIDEEDPLVGGAYGALAGGILGHAYGQGAGEALTKGLDPAAQRSEGLQNLLHWRNAGLLSGPAQLKKPLSDFGTYLTTMVEKGFGNEPGGREVGRNLARELFLSTPTNVRNYIAALKDPRLAKEATNELAKTLGVDSEGPLGLVARPFGAAQYATQMAMERAGVSRDEAIKRLFLGQPDTEAFQKFLGLQKSPYFRAIMPFQRIYTNLAEQGLQRIPGVNMLMGPEDTRLVRGLTGGAALATGAAQGALDQSAEEADPTDVTSPMIRGLRRAALGPLAIPYMLGETMTGPTGLRDLYYSIPGLHGALGAPGTKQSLYDYLKSFAKGQLEQMLPSAAIPWEEK